MLEPIWARSYREKLYRKYDRMASDAFNKHLEYMSEIPKREQAKVEKFVFTF